MVLAGIILILAEIFLIPGIGIAGFLGVLSLCGLLLVRIRLYEPADRISCHHCHVVLLTVLLCYAFRRENLEET